MSGEDGTTPATDATPTPATDAVPTPPTGATDKGGRFLPVGPGAWRLTAASACVGALVWAATAWQGGVELGAGGSEVDGAAETVPADPSGAVLVESAALACPGPELLGVDDPVGEGVNQRAGVLAALAPADLAPSLHQDDGGSAVLRPSGEGAPSEEVSTEAPGGLVLDEAAGAVVLADGTAAPGVVGGQLSVSTEPGTRGAALTACTPPTETVWLVGGGDAAGRTEQLVLTNPGDDAVTVDVDVWGADGPAVTTGAGAVVVPPHARTVHLLDALAGSVEAPVVRVRASGGPVAAHLGEHHRDGTTDLGAELAGPAAAPATDLVVPVTRPDELPAENPARVTLRLAAPGDAAAVVDLTALTTGGAVRMASQVTRVPAGHTVDVALEDLPDGVLALRIRSDTPVTGGARLDLAPSGVDPLPADDVTATSVPDEDDAAVTDRPADVPASTGSPQDDAAVTGSPDDGADVTASAGARPPVVRPAGEAAWVAATTPSLSPLGLALPPRDGIPGARTVLAVSVVDATEATAHLLRDGGRVQRRDLGRLANDTTVTLDVPADVRAVWVTSGGTAGVVASVLVTGADRGGPYVAATTLPAVPWARPTTDVTVVRP